MDLALLEKLGLTRQQAGVYATLLRLGPSSVGQIVKSLTISRISCYDTLNRLIGKGLASFVDSKRNRLYSATDPSRLLGMAEERLRESIQQKELVQKLVPELLKAQRLGSSREGAGIFKTREGVKSIFERMLEVKKPILVVSATGIALKEMRAYFQQWHQRRARLGIPARVIFNTELRNNRLTKMPLSEIRYLPKEYSSPATLFVFGDCVAMLHWADTPFALLTQSGPIAESYSNYFKLIWKLARP